MRFVDSNRSAPQGHDSLVVPSDRSAADRRYDRPFSYFTVKLLKLLIAKETITSQGPIRSSWNSYNPTCPLFAVSIKVELTRGIGTMAFGWPPTYFGKQANKDSELCFGKIVAYLDTY